MKLGAISNGVSRLEAITDGVMDIRFEDIETGIIPDEDVFATITQFVVSVKRQGASRY